MNILDLLKDKSITPRRAAGTHGGEYHSACPACGGNDRFHVWPEQGGEGTFWCRGCEKGGDTIQFLMDFDRLSFPEACRKLGRVLPEMEKYRLPKPPGEKAPYAPPRPTPDQASTPLPAALWLEKAGAFVAWAHKKLLENGKQLAWLRKRGIKKETAIRFHLGWNPGQDNKDFWRPRGSWGLPPEIKDNGQLKKIWIPRGLVIPLMNDNQVCRIRIRRPEGEPRYYVLPGSDMSAMFLRLESRAFVVVESELDAILLDQEAGDIAGVVALGSASAKPTARAYQVLQQAPVILVALDFDEAGRKAAVWWKENFPQAERHPVPCGKDPGDSFQAGINLREWVQLGFPEGWRLGQSFLGQKKRGDDEENIKQPGTDIPPAISELAEILRQHPSIAIRATDTRIKPLVTNNWKAANWETWKKLSQLIFLTDRVMDWLIAHPQDVITGENVGWACPPEG